MRTKGVVKFVNEEKGYSFASVEGHKDVFVHQRHVKTELGRELVIGDVLMFDAAMTDKGYQALNVDVVEPFDTGGGAVLMPGGRVVSGKDNFDEDEIRKDQGIFIPSTPICAARVIKDYFEQHEIEELADYLLLSADA